MRQVTTILGAGLVLLGVLCAGSAQAQQATVTYSITNMGMDVGNKASAVFYPAGNHNNSVASAYSGNQAMMPAGTYDIDIHFDDGDVHKEVWVDHVAIAGVVAKSLELNVGVAHAATTVTNAGQDVGNKASTVYYAAGKHDKTVSSVYSAGQVTLPPGNYDIDISFNDGDVHKEIWLDGVAVAGNFTKTVDIAVGVAHAATTVTNAGQDVGNKASTVYYTAGKHDKTVSSAYSAGQVTLPPGNYDIDINFNDGDVHKEIWLNGVAIAGNFTRSVDIGTGVASASTTVTNAGQDVGNKASTVYYIAGKHDKTVSSAYSAGQVTLPPGDYDIDINFNDGDVHKEIWLNGQKISGNYSKTVELGVSIANVTVTVNNNGQDTGNLSTVSYFPSGKYDNAVSTGYSNSSHTLPQASYDIHISFADQLARKEMWLYNQPLSGTVAKSVDLGLALALPTVNVTENGQKPVDAAGVVYVDAGGNNLGSVAAGTQTVVGVGTYDIEANIGDATGWLHGKVLPAGAETLTIDISTKAKQAAALAVSQLVVKRCTIEAYGVNFDFDKATLRPDSTPTLQQILALFTADPKFSGEIGGHTDNIGPRPYNMKLSAARAEAVKAWLVGQGVADSRVTTAGYADTRPLVPNTSDSNRFKNRRVEIKRMACGS